MMQAESNIIIRRCKRLGINVLGTTSLRHTRQSTYVLYCTKQESLGVSLMTITMQTLNVSVDMIALNNIK